MTSNATLRAAAVASVVMFAACGDDGGSRADGGLAGTGTTGGSASSGAGGTGLDIPGARMLFEPIVRAQCDWIFGCCNASERALELGSAVADAQECTDRILDSIVFGQPIPVSLELFSPNGAQLVTYFATDFDEERVVVDQAGLTACADSLRTRPCTAPAAGGAQCSPVIPAANDPCDTRAFVMGQQGLGDPCRVTEECATDLRCQVFGGDGVCLPLMDIGAPCFDDFNCDFSTEVCDGATGTCIAAAGPGEPCAYQDPANPVVGAESVRCRRQLVCDPIALTCVDSNECAFGSFCSNDSSQCPAGLECVQFNCGFRRNVGERCFNHSDRLSDRCDFTSNRCVDGASFGAPCQSPQQCISGFCDFTGASPTCGTTVGVGQQCPSFDSQQCGDGYCDTAQMVPTCVAYLPEGAMCTGSQQCGPSFGDDVPTCWFSECHVYPVPLGAGCNGDFDCRDGICEGSICAAGLAEGSACALDGSTGRCGIDSFCDESTGQCAPVGATGVPCLDDTHCSSGFCSTVRGELRCSRDGPICTGA